MGLSGTPEKWFESRWGYQNRPDITRVSATLSGFVQQMCNNEALFVSSRRASRRRPPRRRLDPSTRANNAYRLLVVVRRHSDLPSSVTHPSPRPSLRTKLLSDASGERYRYWRFKIAVGGTRTPNLQVRGASPSAGGGRGNPYRHSAGAIYWRYGFVPLRSSPTASAKTPCRRYAHRPTASCRKGRRSGATAPPRGPNRRRSRRRNAVRSRRRSS